MIKKFINLWAISDLLPATADCLIGLSYALKSNTDLTPMTKAVLDKLITLYKKFPRSKIIVSTGDNQRLGVSNARIMASYLERKKIPRSAILLEEKSSNTYENIFYTGEILQKNKLYRPILVTYDLHMRRSLAAAKKTDLSCAWVSAPTAKVAMGKRKWWQLNRVSMLIYEVFAYVFSRFVGWA